MLLLFNFGTLQAQRVVSVAPCGADFSLFISPSPYTLVHRNTGQRHFPVANNVCNLRCDYPSGIYDVFNGLTGGAAPVFLYANGTLTATNSNVLTIIKPEFLITSETESTPNCNVKIIRYKVCINNLTNLPTNWVNTEAIDIRLNYPSGINATYAPNFLNGAGTYVISGNPVRISANNPCFEFSVTLTDNRPSPQGYTVIANSSLPDPPPITYRIDSSRLCENVRPCKCSSISPSNQVTNISYGNQARFNYTLDNASGICKETPHTARLRLCLDPNSDIGLPLTVNQLTLTTSAGYTATLSGFAPMTFSSFNDCREVDVNINSVLNTPLIGNLSVTGNFTSACVTSPVSIASAALPVSFRDCSIPPVCVACAGAIRISSNSSGIRNLSQIRNLIPNAIHTGGCINVQGKLVINQNQVFRNVEFFMEEGAEIAIANGVRLDLTGCNLHGCQKMWKGVTAQTGSQILATNSTFKDAHAAIEFQGRVIVRGMSGNTFHQNYIGLLADYNPQGNQIILRNCFIEGNYFSGDVLRRQLLPNYVGQRPLSGIYMPAPFDVNVSFPHAGIVFRDVNSIRIGNAAVAIVGVPNVVSLNVFQSLIEGVVMENSNGAIQNNSFDVIGIIQRTANIQGIDYTYEPPLSSSGNAIRVESSNTIQVQNNYMAKVATCLRTYDVSNVVAQNHNLSDGRFASFLHTYTRPYTSLLVQNNVLGTTAAYGVGVFNPSGATSIGNINIYRNRLDYDDLENNIAARFAIGLSNIRTRNGAQTRILRNRVGTFPLSTANQNATSRQGFIALNGVNSNTEITRDTIVTGLPTIYTQGQTSIGLSLNNTNNVYLQENNVFAVTQLSRRSVGITAANSKDLEFCNNRLSGHKNAFEFNANCASTGLNGRRTDLKSTQFDNNSLGLYLNGVIGSQINYANDWYANHNTWNAVADLMTNFRLSPIITKKPVPNVTPSTDWFSDNGRDDVDCQPLTVPIRGGNGQAALTAEDVLIAKKELYLREANQHSNVYRLEQSFLYEKLLEYPDLLGLDGDVDAFHQETATKNIAKFATIRSGIQQLFAPNDTFVAQHHELSMTLHAQHVQLLAIDSMLNTANLKTEQMQALENQRQATQETIAMLTRNYEAFIRPIYWSCEQKSCALKTENDNIVPENLQDELERAINRLTLKLIGAKYVNFTAEEQLYIDNVAATCPYVGGRAVYDARALQAHYKSAVYSDVELCTPQKEKSKQQRIAPTANKLYPNPANSVVTVELSERVTNPQTRLSIKDELGRIVLTKLLEEGIQSTSIDTDSLSAGIYFVSISDEKVVLMNEKLVIIK